MSCASPGSPRILLVASDENFRRTLGRILCRSGYATEAVSCGEDAIGALEREPYDLVLSEVRLPGMCGVTMLCDARRHGRTIPFILLAESETERLRWILSGIDGVRCLHLPVDVDRLKEVVAACLGTAS
jgi:DNA-binding response OmpR family regulator